MAAVVTGMGHVLIVCGVPGTQDFTHNNCHTLKVCCGPAMVLNVLHVFTAGMFTNLSCQKSDGGVGRL